MRRWFNIVFLLFLMGGASVTYSNSCFAGVTLPWSTTFNCSQFLNYTDSWSCDGLNKPASYNVCGYYSQITSAANDPNGGGNGFRNWIGDGDNVGSGSTILSFSTPQPEMWIRWYMRYEKGFQWNPLSYHKLFYINAGVSGTDAIVGPLGSDGFGIYAQGGSGHLAESLSGSGWQTWMAGAQSDGQWKLMEVHIKMDTNGSNGIGEFWYNGVKKFSFTNVNFGTTAGWTYMQIASNHAIPNNGTCDYVDFDDIAISKTGYIGPVSSVTTVAKPEPPSNFQAK